MAGKWTLNSAPVTQLEQCLQLTLSDGEMGVAISFAFGAKIGDTVPLTQVPRALSADYGGPWAPPPVVGTVI